MRLTDLTLEHLERIERQVDRQRAYYLKLWTRAQGNGITLDDPFVQRICHAWDRINHFRETLEQLQRGKPRPYRPLAKATKTSGLREVELLWAEHQRRMAEACRAERAKPKTPRT